MNKNTSSGHLVAFHHRVRDVYRCFGYHPYIAVNAPVIRKIEGILRFTRRIRLIIAVVGANRYQASIAGFHSKFVQINGKRQIPTQMLQDLFTVEIDGGTAHHGFKVQGNLLPLQRGIRNKALSVPGFALIIASAAAFGRHQLDSVG
ncbi:MAG: hypothetical protein BWX77_00820 [Bacteroidetes bacterium ADurb.Bin090]|nr:MAG: hypothetical protein BWX77_00820 [Bacteroidetes bacterium ADurb.Bin090]